MMCWTVTFHLILLLFITTSAVLARPSKWSASKPTRDDELIKIFFLIKQQNVQILKERLMNVSNPSHQHYGDYWTIEHMNDLIKPYDHHHRSVTDWLSGHKVLDGAVVYSDAIRIKVRADVASRMFNATFRQYRHRDMNAVIHRVDTPSNVFIPPEVANAVDVILGIYDFPNIQARSPYKDDLYNADILGNGTSQRVFLPYTMVNMYGLPPTSSIATSSQGVIAFSGADSGINGGASFSQSDLSLYAYTLNLGQRTVANIFGNNDQTHISEESNLDIQMIVGVNGGAATYFYLMDSSVWIYSAILQVVNSDSTPSVISVSYSATEQYCDNAECEQYSFYNYQTYIQRTDIELIKLNLRGTTILASSGDDGANFANEECCYTGAYTQYGTPGFLASYPASSPYVLAVGATDIPVQVQQANFSFRYPIEYCEPNYYTCVSGPPQSEVAVNIAETMYTSGGGFSAVESIPYYQYNAVQTYLTRASQLPPASYWNASYRGYPDVSALGGPMFIILNNTIRRPGGTSASTPIFAAIISRLNDISIRLRGHTLGFINPLFYQMSNNISYQTFNDIIIGDNICPQFNPNCNSVLCGGNCQGYSTAVGWDPVTGLGTPNYTEMVRYITDYNYQSNLTYNSQSHQYNHNIISKLTLHMLLCIVVIIITFLQ